MDEKLRQSFVVTFLIFIFIEIVGFGLYWFKLISMGVLWGFMVFILGLVALVAAVYYSIQGQEEYKKEMEKKVVAREDIQKCVKDWIDDVKQKVFKDHYETYDDIYAYYVDPIMRCPRCLSQNVGINLETMKCGKCDFIIPEIFQPPQPKALMEFFVEEKKKKKEEEKKKIKEVRDEMIFRAGMRLAIMGYENNE